MTKISLKDIQEDANNLIKEFQPLNHSEILQQIYKKIEKVNFREKAKIKNEKDQVKRKHHLICCIEVVLEIAKKNKWAICRHNELIYLYNSNYWSYIDKDKLQEFLGHAAERMGVEKFDARHYIFREQLYKQFHSGGYMAKPEPKKDIVLINLKNGTFEISPQKQFLRNPHFKDFLTYQLPFEYRFNAKAPLFQNYLDKVLPEKELQMILSEYLAYVFISPATLKLEKVLLLYGTGANGKSVFFDIVNALLGTENVSSYSIKSLTDESGYSRAMLANKLVNYASEINGKLETSIFKQLVSGEPVEARLPYIPPFTLANYAKLIFNCNELPKDVEQTYAYFRRFLIVPFKVTIPEAEQDKELSKKIIQNELSGIFNWVLDGLKRLLAQKDFSKSITVTEQIEQYKIQSDSVQLFLADENYIKATNEDIPLKDLYKEYRIYCDYSGHRFCSLRTFSDRLRGIGFAIERKNYGNTVFIKKDL
ncbi:MAG: DNA primase [Saprospiraceae bacterium]|nr:DNA primase [Saprospiraceae bacterium]